MADTQINVPLRQIQWSTRKQLRVWESWRDKETLNIHISISCSTEIIILIRIWNLNWFRLVIQWSKFYLCCGCCVCIQPLECFKRDSMICSSCSLVRNDSCLFFLSSFIYLSPVSHLWLCGRRSFQSFITWSDHLTNVSFCKWIKSMIFTLVQSSKFFFSIFVG